MRFRATLTGLAWISPWLVGFLAFMALPLGMSLYYSFTDYPLIEKPLWIGLDNYRAMVHDPVFWIVLKNTLIYAAFSIPLSTIIAVAIAALLNQKVAGVGFYRAAIFVPVVVPAVASAMIGLWMFNGELGLVNQAVSGALLPSPPHPRKTNSPRPMPLPGSHHADPPQTPTSASPAAASPSADAATCRQCAGSEAICSSAPDGARSADLPVAQSADSAQVPQSGT